MRTGADVLARQRPGAQGATSTPPSTAGLRDPTTRRHTSELGPSPGTHARWDARLIGKLWTSTPETDGPSTAATRGARRRLTALVGVDPGSPRGGHGIFPTAAIQNAPAAVRGSELAAALRRRPMPAWPPPRTRPPTTRDVQRQANDAAAYNSDMMEESYLVVPTTGLTAAKATALAQFVRFILGTQGQKDIESFGSAPATPAMQAAGLKVATELDAEATGTRPRRRSVVPLPGPPRRPLPGRPRHRGGGRNGHVQRVERLRRLFGFLGERIGVHRHGRPGCLGPARAARSRRRHLRRRLRRREARS